MESEGQTSSYEQKCPICGNGLRNGLCPKCGETTRPSQEELQKVLGKSFYLSFAGLAGLAAATYGYPTLERSYLSVIAAFLFFLPLILHWARSKSKRLAADVNRLKTAYWCCSAGVMLIALVFAMNGALDWKRPTVVRSRVIQIRVTHGRYYSSTNHLVLASWRPGRATEDVSVGDALYSRATVGQQVSLEVHPGLFGLPWYNRVRLE